VLQVIRDDGLPKRVMKDVYAELQSAEGACA
jgi:hypothetical protein